MNARPSPDFSERIGLKIDEVARLLGVSKRLIFKLLAAGQFPPPFRLGRAVRWLRADIEAFVRSAKGEVDEID